MCSLQKIAESEQRVDCRPRPACGLLATQPSNHRGHASPDSRCSVVRVGECVCEMHSAYARTHTQQQHMQPRRPPGRTPQSLHDGLGGAGTTKPCLGLPAAAAGPPLIPSTNICGPPLFFPPPLTSTAQNPKPRQPSRLAQPLSTTPPAERHLKPTKSGQTSGTRVHIGREDGLYTDRAPERGEERTTTHTERAWGKRRGSHVGWRKRIPAARYTPIDRPLHCLEQADARQPERMTKTLYTHTHTHQE